MEAEKARFKHNGKRGACIQTETGKNIDMAIRSLQMLKSTDADVKCAYDAGGHFPKSQIKESSKCYQS